jgi:tight adherence protein B
MIGALQKALRQAGMKTPVDKFVLTFLFIPLGFGFVLMLLLKNPMMLFLGIAIFVVAVMMVKMRQKKRLNRISTQLPDALNLITSSLRAGHSFQSAMTIVVNELPDPLASEFAQVVSDINWGIPVKDALTKMVNSLDGLVDIRMFVTSLIIQRETGGNLAEILDKLSTTIRERFKLKGQIAALTGQARLTGYILGCAPAGLFLFLSLFMGKYVEPLTTTEIGKVALVVACIMQIIGFFVMKKIIEIRV